MAHIMLFHYINVQDKAKTIEFIFAVFFAISIVIMLGLPNNFLFKDIKYSKALNIASYINAAILYFLLFYTYIGFYFLIDRSISVRTMIELERQPQIGMTKQELFVYYNGNMIMDRRLEHLVYGKFTKLEDNHYINTWKASLIAKTFKFLKKFLNLSQGG